MAARETKAEATRQLILTEEQEVLLDQYLNRLDTYLEELKTTERIQVEIETLHLKRMLSK